MGFRKGYREGASLRKIDENDRITIPMTMHRQ